MPTPFVGSADASRTVKLKYCQCKMITGTIAIQIPLLMGRQKPVDYPLSVEQCMQLIQAIEPQLPETAPDCCCMDQDILLLESQIYQLGRWRVFMEEQIASRPPQPPSTGLFSLIAESLAESKTMREYKQLEELRQRLTIPSH